MCATGGQSAPYSPRIPAILQRTSPTGGGGFLAVLTRKQNFTQSDGAWWAVNTKMPHHIALQSLERLPSLRHRVIPQACKQSTGGCAWRRHRWLDSSQFSVDARGFPADSRDCPAPSEAPPTQRFGSPALFSAPTTKPPNAVNVKTPNCTVPPSLDCAPTPPATAHAGGIPAMRPAGG